ncbi:MAG: hypothetical protein O3A51_03630 [Verrucomicrobia bacterium]|nr:hypothetical protein [Verrucomicrobiota bacterium]
MSFNRLQNLRGRERVGLLLCVAVLLVLVLDNFVVRPMSERYRQLDMAIAGEAQKLTYHDSVMDAAGAIEARFRDIQAKLGASLPQAEAIAQMRGEIDRLAEDTNVVLLSMKHRDPLSKTYYDEYMLDVSEFETDEISLMRFLHGLRSLPGTFQVARLKINPDRSGSIIRGSMTITKVMMLSAPQ